jgi:hypothetical protein
LASNRKNVVPSGGKAIITYLPLLFKDMGGYTEKINVNRPDKP